MIIDRSNDADIILQIIEVLKNGLPLESQKYTVICEILDGVKREIETTKNLEL